MLHRHGPRCPATHGQGPVPGLRRHRRGVHPLPGEHPLVAFPLSEPRVPGHQVAARGDGKRATARRGAPGLAVGEPAQQLLGRAAGTTAAQHLGDQHRDQPDAHRHRHRLPGAEPPAQAQTPSTEHRGHDQRLQQVEAQRALTDSRNGLHHHGRALLPAGPDQPEQAGISNAGRQARRIRSQRERLAVVGTNDLQLHHGLQRSQRPPRNDRDHRDGRQQPLVGSGVLEQPMTRCQPPCDHHRGQPDDHRQRHPRQPHRQTPQHRAEVAHVSVGLPDDRGPVRGLRHVPVGAEATRKPMGQTNQRRQQRDQGEQNHHPHP